MIGDQNIKINLIMKDKEAYVFGLLFLDDGATISQIILINNLVSGEDLPVTVLELVDCQVHLAGGIKKDRSFICCIFLENMVVIDPDKSLTDIIRFMDLHMYNLLVNF